MKFASKDKYTGVRLGQRVVRFLIFFLFVITPVSTILGQSSVNRNRDSRSISPELFGLFFEDINYAADGGIYAELVQNRSFEYNPTEQRGWNPLSYWEYVTPGFSYGQVSVETTSPVHLNNPHYIVLDIEHVGREEKHTGPSGVGMKNAGFDGIVVNGGEEYHLSLFARQLSDKPIQLQISLQTPGGQVLAEQQISTTSRDWKKYDATLRTTTASDSASLVILATTTGRLAMDVISLFPSHTFRKRVNGLRQDLVQVLADLKPKFIRFPGGCLVHGDGIRNMYRWKNTIGPIEQRVEQRNIWGYHQTGGLGYFEYFQLCEDIGAKPLPVLPAAVSCQNSGGTWRIGGTGQRPLTLEEMDEYIQEVLDLIEWANGPATSEWGSKRAAAGHPEPFHLEYIGIGNEDKITQEFKVRFKMINDAIKAKHPEVTVVGTVGPFPDGEDFSRGWEFASGLNIPIVDEHYYKEPEWLLENQFRYDSYDRRKTQVYLGEYASWGNKMINAVAEAIYMIGLERNGDIVRMASYAPLLAKQGHVQWKTNMIFFDNKRICRTPNYYVQQLFSLNNGSVYFDKVVSISPGLKTLASSCVQDKSSGDVIIKVANAGTEQQTISADLSPFGRIVTTAEQTVLAGHADDENTLDSPRKIVPIKSAISAAKHFRYTAPPMSLTVIRIRTKR
jgi:alpha-L-arabinofuranosidase